MDIKNKIKENIHNNNKDLIYQQKNLNENQTNFLETQKYNLINSNNNIIPNLKNNIYNNSNMTNQQIGNNNLEIGYNIPDSLESSISTKINENNIAILNERIKKQENDIIYLNNRLKNYDMCVEEITQLNFEINKLNEIINNKNNTIQEFRKITDLSKNKIEELINSKKELIQKINIIENENKKLNNLYNHENKNIYYNSFERKNIDNVKLEDYNKLKIDLDKISEENRRLRNQINEKDDKIKYLNNIIKTLKEENKLKEPSIKAINNWKKINQNNRTTYYIQGRNHTPLSTDLYNQKYDFIPKYDHSRKEYSFRTETNSVTNNPNKNNNSKLMVHSFQNKYNYLKNKYRVNPLDYSNYLLDNLQDNISQHYNA